MKHIRNLLNDNGRAKQSFDINDIERKNPYYVDQVADWLMRELGSSISRPYYCKIARYIPRDQLSNMLAIARGRGRHPAKLFTHLAEKYLRNQGINK